MFYLSDFCLRDKYFADFSSRFNAVKNLVLKPTMIKRPFGGGKYLGNRWVKVKEVLVNNGKAKTLVEANPKLSRDLTTYETLKNRTRKVKIPEQMILDANKTARAAGNVSNKALTPRYVMDNIPKTSSILDFGSGNKAPHTLMLRAKGFKNVTAYDFGTNLVKGVHDSKALNKKYDVVFASNVLNVQGNEDMLKSTLSSIAKSTKPDGQAIFNFPVEPRYGAWQFTNDVRKSKPANALDFKTKDVSHLDTRIKDYFEEFEKVKGYGNNQAPLYIARKPKK